MPRQVASRLELAVDGPAVVALQIAVARGVEEAAGIDESFEVRLDGERFEPRVLTAPHGGRLHVLDVPAGRLVVEYTATIGGPIGQAGFDELDLLTYLRPSRYSESDRLAAIAAAEFSGLSGKVLLDAVCSWVGGRLEYEAGSSGSTDGAIATLLAGRGVCRDYAHLTVALLRAMDVPARAVAVYAPGLDPMDFHAVAEVYVDGDWWVVDPTLLAPRPAMLRIATGPDAAATAFLSTYGAAVELEQLTIMAITSGDLPKDDVMGLVRLA